jgi:CheY-like chemotaxis protein
MHLPLEEKRIFLIVSSDPSKIRLFEKLVKKHISRPTIYTAPDGSAAMAKIKNVPPSVLITDLQLTRMTGTSLVDTLSKDFRFKTLAIIITDQPPEEEQYIDELVTGKIQFLGDDRNEDGFVYCLMKALNFTSHGIEADFYLRFLSNGDPLISEGDRADFIYIVKKGQLRAFKSSPEGGTVTLGYIEVGEFVGEMAYINGVPRTASVEALSDCELIEVPIGTFEKVLYRRPSWSKALMLTLSKRLKQANEIRTASPED